MRVTDISCVNCYFALIDGAGDRRGGGGFGSGGERDVAFAREQSRGRIEADPAGARQIDFGPGVQIGEILLRARAGHPAVSCRASTGSGSRRRSAPPVPDGAGFPPAARRCRGRNRSERQRLFARLDARLHANEIAHLVLQLLVHSDQKIDGTLLGDIDGLQIRRQLGTGRADFAKRRSSCSSAGS